MSGTRRQRQRRASATSRLNAVIERHQPLEALNPPLCRACLEEHPCPTLKDAEGILVDEASP